MGKMENREEFPAVSAPWQEPLQTESGVSSLGWKMMNGLPVLSSSCLDAARGPGDECVSVCVGLGGSAWRGVLYKTRIQDISLLSVWGEAGSWGPAHRQSIEPI